MNHSDELTIEEAAERIRSASNIIDMMKSVNLDPKIHFRGGDWRNCDFRELDLRNCDFTNARLYRAKFRGAKVAGADFRGAADIDMTGIQFAQDWRMATLDPDQRDTLELIDRLGLIQDHPSSVLEKLRKSPRPLNFLQYLKLIRNAPNYQTAYAVVQEIRRRNLLEDARPYELLMPRCELPSQAAALLDEFIATGFPVTGKLLVAYSQFISHIDGFKRVFKLAKEENDCNTNQIFNIALKLADNISQVTAYIDIMSEQGFVPDSFTLHEVFRNDHEFSHRQTMLQHWHKNKYQISAANLNELAFSARDRTNLDAALKWFDKLEINFDEYSFCAMMNFSSNFQESKFIYSKMIDSGITPTMNSAKWLVRSASNFNEACEALVLSCHNGVAIHDYQLITLLPEKTQTVTKSRRLMRDQREEGKSAAHALRGIVNDQHKAAGTADRNKLLVALGLPPNRP